MDSGLKSSSKIVLLASLYFSQGLPFGFFTQALPVLLRESGVSLTAIGFTSFLGLPWLLKFLWSPLVDRYFSARFGRRRSWIIPLQVLAAGFLALLAFFGDGDAYVWMMVAVLCTNFFAATQDVATDALAVDVLRPEERGIGNGVQVAGYRVGMIVGGGALLVLFETIGWRETFLTAAGLLCLASIPILLFREEPVTPAKKETSSFPFTDLWHAVRRPGFVQWMVVLATFKFGDALGTAMVRPLFVDVGMSMSEIGVVMGLGGFGAGLAGALVGGWFTTRLGRRRALLSFGVITGFAMLMYMAPALGYVNRIVIWSAVMAEHFCGGMATVALFTMMMDQCRPEQAATDYTLQASIVVGVTGASGTLSGILAQNLGYAVHFGLAALLCWFGVWVAFVRARPELMPAGRAAVETSYA